MSSDGFSTSTDAGIHWDTKTTGPGSYATSFGIVGQGEHTIESDPRGSGALIANSGTTAMLSRDRGTTWTGLRPPTGQTSSTATFSRTRTGRIYSAVGAGAAGSLWASDDWGQTWSLTKAQPDRAVVDLFTEAAAPDRLYVLTLGSLRVSEDGAESWINTNTDVLLGYQVSRPMACGSGTLLVATSGGNQLSVSSDRGQTWQATPLRDVQTFTAGAGCSIYALKAMSGDGFVARLDRTGAIEWSTCPGGLAADFVTALSTDTAGNVLVAGTCGSFADVLIAKYGSDDGFCGRRLLAAGFRTRRWTSRLTGPGTSLSQAGLVPQIFRLRRERHGRSPHPGS